MAWNWPFFAHDRVWVDICGFWARIAVLAWASGEYAKKSIWRATETGEKSAWRPSNWGRKGRSWRKAIQDSPFVHLLDRLALADVLVWADIPRLASVGVGHRKQGWKRTDLWVCKATDWEPGVEVTKKSDCWWTETGEGLPGGLPIWWETGI
jgi:hypothetical protein